MLRREYEFDNAALLDETAMDEYDHNDNIYNKLAALSESEGRDIKLVYYISKTFSRGDLLCCLFRIEDDQWHDHSSLFRQLEKEQHLVPLILKKDLLEKDALLKAFASMAR